MCGWRNAVLDSKSAPWAKNPWQPRAGFTMPQLTIGDGFSTLHLAIHVDGTTKLLSSLTPLLEAFMREETT
jgi:hypothetical protein